MTDVQKVLILDGDMRHAVTIVRSLGLEGIAVHVASHTGDPIAGVSRYCSEVLRYPDPLENESDFIAWVGETCASRDYRLVIPVTERTLVPLDGLLETVQQVVQAAYDAIAATIVEVPFE